MNSELVEKDHEDSPEEVITMAWITNKDGDHIKVTATETGATMSLTDGNNGEWVVLGFDSADNPSITLALLDLMWAIWRDGGKIA